MNSTHEISRNEVETTVSLFKTLKITSAKKLKSILTPKKATKKSAEKSIKPSAATPTCALDDISLLYDFAYKYGESNQLESQSVTCLLIISQLEKTTERNDKYYDLLSKTYNMLGILFEKKKNPENQILNFEHAMWAANLITNPDRKHYLYAKALINLMNAKYTLNDNNKNFLIDGFTQALDKLSQINNPDDSTLYLKLLAYKGWLFCLNYSPWNASMEHICSNVKILFTQIQSYNEDIQKMQSFFSEAFPHEEFNCFNKRKFDEISNDHESEEGFLFAPPSSPKN